MKNKIKLTMTPEEITEAELTQFRDFDLLLKKHQQINSIRIKRWKVIAPIVLGVLTVTCLFINNYEERKVIISSVGDSVSMDSTTKLHDQPVKPDVLEKAETHNSRATEKPLKTKNSSPSSSPSTISQHQKTIPAKTETVKQTVEQKEEVPTSPLSKPNPVYVQAEPIAGYEALYAYFQKELRYPQEAMKDSVQGILTVTFVINTLGVPEQISTSGLPGEAFDAEGIRLIKGMPLWKPATLNGEPVLSKLTLPLTFQLQKK